MSRTTDLLDRWKKHKGIKSDNQAAKTLKLTRSAISHWRNDVNDADLDTIIRMAAELHTDAVREVAIIEGSKAKSDHAKRFWHQLVRFSGTAAIITLAILTLNITAKENDFKGIIAKNGGFDTLYICVEKVRKILARLTGSLRIKMYGFEPKRI